MKRSSLVKGAGKLILKSLIELAPFRPYPQILDYAGKACQGQTLLPGVCIIKLITAIINSVTYKASMFVKASKM